MHTNIFADHQASLQIRGFEVNPFSYRFSGFPHQVSFWINSTSSADPHVIIKPPIAHRKRKETPWNIPTDCLRYLDNNTITVS